MATVFLILLVWSFRILEIEWFFFFGCNLLMGVVLVKGFDLMIGLFWLEQDEDKCVLFFIIEKYGYG